MTALYYSFKPCESDEFIKMALKKFCGEDKDFVIIREKGKKPYVKEENLYFSLSHTKGLIICAVSDRKVGADTEKIRNIKSKEKIITRFLKKEAKKNISDEEFLSQWTRFESIVKYNGEIILNPTELTNDKINITDLKMNGYIISVCSEDIKIEKEQII